MEYMHLTRCGAEQKMGPSPGPAHTWEQSRVYSPPEGRYVEQGAEHCVAPWSELVARGATGLGGADAEAFRRWLADGAPGAVERTWDEARGEYVEAA
jgi:hypothetical protein